MIFVRTDNISNRMYAGVFKICAEGFWLSATALINNIYVVLLNSPVNYFCQRLFYFYEYVIIAASLYPVKMLFVRNGFMNFEKLLFVKPFSVSF